ncbi:basic-leucine zipper transcription factor f-related [Anaeramoeba flamelloides]|uniref:Basic-leucine zipper transcription factor f-related n=1 Tax=Anaeramoeba flamelloides TaxID=1746091 RepID=A0ABQ8YWI3_9EUKA|nr:basic-leucine zipper transcription factor f-related [Anaeramoeba flamelloides]
MSIDSLNFNASFFTDFSISSDLLNKPNNNFLNEPKIIIDGKPQEQKQEKKEKQEEKEQKSKNTTIKNQKNEIKPNIFPSLPNTYRRNRLQTNATVNNTPIPNNFLNLYNDKKKENEKKKEIVQNNYKPHPTDTINNGTTNKKQITQTRNHLNTKKRRRRRKKLSKKQKKLLTLERNRVNARKCRQRKKEYVQNLESQTLQLKNQNTELNKNMDLVREENDNLKELIKILGKALKQQQKEEMLNNDQSFLLNEENEKIEEKDQQINPENECFFVQPSTTPQLESEFDFDFDSNNEFLNGFEQSPSPIQSFSNGIDDLFDIDNSLQENEINFNSIASPNVKIGTNF